MMKNEPPVDGYSFRLEVDSSSTYSDSSTTERSSVYKQRIDSLFRQKRSSFSPEQTGGSNSDYETVDRGSEAPSQQFQDVRSAVQAQIERIFAGNNLTSQPQSPSRRPLPIPPTLQNKKIVEQQSNGGLSKRHAPTQRIEQQRTEPSPKPTHPTSNTPSDTPRNKNPIKFKVDYLGALPIDDKATRLEDLQIPLKMLYMEYQILHKRGRTPLPGTLEIAEHGVKVEYVRELHKGVQEVFNPFATIAVWAAVKFVAKKQINSRGQMELKFAFLPLICDPESQEKFTLYNDLEINLITEAIGVNHPPVFACVMRKPGLVKTLECHGFVCATSEDAIVMAANLYQSLLSSMQSDSSAVPSPRLNTSKSSNSSGDAGSDDREGPRRPPRRRRAPQPPADRGHQPRARPDNVPDERRRVQRRRSSVRSQSRSQSRGGPESGDSRRARSSSRSASIRKSRRMTRSASDRRRGIIEGNALGGVRKNSLPRSSSVLDVNQRINMREFLEKLQERDGIRTVDDVLKQVVHPGGMSFSELKPEHRELLLRLALTLSQDEMYHRSKNIMKKQTKKISSMAESDTDGSTISNVLKATKKSFSRLSTRSGSFQTPTSYLRGHSPLKKFYNIKPNYTKGSIRSGHETTRMASYVTQNSIAAGQRLSSSSSSIVMPKNPKARRAHRAEEPEEPCDCGCDSESVYSSKCYCSLPRAGQLIKAKSTYDLPCDCETESCAESEKCYCSLKKVTKNGMKLYEIKLDSESDTTDATVKSVNRTGQGRRQFGSMSNLSRVDSPSTAWRKNASSVQSDMARGKSASSLLSTSSGMMKDKSSSTVYGDQRGVLRRRIHSSNLSLNSENSSQAARQNPAKSFSIDNLHHSANGFIFNRLNSVSSLSTASNQSNGSGSRFMLVSAADPSGKIVYRSGSQRDRPTKAHDIMSLKKTTEIAATFSGLKLNQTTDLLNESEDDAYGSMQHTSNNTTPSSHVYSGQNIENTLGYLP